MTSAGWYLRRLSRMGPREIAGRAVAAARIRRLRRAVNPPADESRWLADRWFAAILPDEVYQAIPATAVARLIQTAERLMDGHATYFGVRRDDLVNPDWFLDQKTGRRAPADVFAFDVRYRDEQAVGDVKQLWEPSRHQHLTVLAAAYAVTGNDRYAIRVADHLKSWWAANPPLRGVHWVSGIELGIRLISWVWVRRLLDGWPGAPGLFEDNPEALHQIWHHQRWLAALGSHGSSANNHVIAEAAGQLVAGCAFGWFVESKRWRRDALRTLDVQLGRNTFGSGLNRELASEYHGLVLELGLAAAIEAGAAGLDVPESTWLVLLGMTDALAAVLDGRLRPPRQGDADDGHGLIVDGAGTDRWASLLATGGRLFGALPWWPAAGASDARTELLTALVARPVPVLGKARPDRLPVQLPDAGLTILRGTSRDGGQIWCRCDGGPHGFLSIAAHAHADALSVEVRHDGVDVLADPGTYCYHGQPRWRSYFRSTLGHNTLQLDDRDQSVSGGPFLWTRHARTKVLTAPPDQRAGVGSWVAEHDGYAGRRGGVHRRLVELDGTGVLRIVDLVSGRNRRRCRLAFHLGPKIAVELSGSTARLRWDSDGRQLGAQLELPPQLAWSAHRGQAEPPLGWYSPGFGQLVPAWTLIGSGLAGGADAFTTTLRFGS